MLTELGLRPVLLTGENETTARAVAAQVGIAEVIAEVLPADKADVITGLQREGRVVAMPTRSRRADRRDGPRMLWPVRAPAVSLLLAVVLAACGEDDQAAPFEVEDPGVVHVHGLGRNPADGSLMIATHTGLFRAGAEGADPVRVAGRFQDTMGFTVVGPDHFLGSGHPGSVRDDPPFLGLIESRDAGNNWRPISLRGEVDFHVLEAQDERVYGFGSDFETREARFLTSEDGGRSWKSLSPPEPLTGLAIDPGDSRHIVALGEEGSYVSRDGGSGWRPLGIPGGLVSWTREVGLVAVDPHGIVRSADDATEEWEEVGSVDGNPAALEGVGDELLVATHDARVLSSRDGGKSWREILGP